MAPMKVHSGGFLQNASESDDKSCRMLRDLCFYVISHCEHKITTRHYQFAAAAPADAEYQFAPWHCHLASPPGSLIFKKPQRLVLDLYRGRFLQTTTHFAELLLRSTN